MQAKEIGSKTPAEAAEILMGMGIDATTEFYEGGWCDEYELPDGTIEIYNDKNEGQFTIVTLVD